MMRKVINIVNNENMKCDKCGSTKIEQKDCKVYTTGPKVKKHPNRRTSYGYFCTKYTCHCRVEDYKRNMFKLLGK
jgi:hypothetical protein